jgi:hypothetical protein
LLSEDPLSEDPLGEDLLSEDPLSEEAAEADSGPTSTAVATKAEIVSRLANLLLIIIFCSLLVWRIL